MTDNRGDFPSLSFGPSPRDPEKWKGHGALAVVLWWAGIAVVILIAILGYFAPERAVVLVNGALWDLTGLVVCSFFVPPILWLLALIFRDRTAAASRRKKLSRIGAIIIAVILTLPVGPLALFSYVALGPGKFTTLLPASPTGCQLVVEENRTFRMRLYGTVYVASPAHPLLQRTSAGWSSGKTEHNPFTEKEWSLRWVGDEAILEIFPSDSRVTVYGAEPIVCPE